MGEDIVFRFAPLRATDADLHARERIGAELFDNRADAVLAARTPLAAQAQMAERQIEIVVDDQDFF